MFIVTGAALLLHGCHFELPFRSHPGLSHADSKAIQLTTNTTDDFLPSWSPDGQEILFVKQYAGNRDIWIMNREGGQQRPLVNTSRQEADPSWSPDGSLIVFSSYLGTRWPALWVIDHNGNNLRQLTREDHIRKDIYPVWSPSRSEIALVTLIMKRPPQWILSVLDSHGNNRKDYPEIPVSNSRPAWSPDGQWIAFGSSQSRSLHIWIMDRNGNNLHPLTQGKAHDDFPSWSPDGQRIAFASDRAGNWDIWIMDTQGAHLKRITWTRSKETHPSWSPDGRQIAFTSDRAGNQDIWIMRTSTLSDKR